jgi:hypothetical protein
VTLKRYLILVGALLGLSSIAVGFEIGATAMRILVTLLMLITVNADGRSRRVIIYPLVSDRREFTFTAYGPSVYAGYEIVATVVVADQMDRLYGIHCRATKRWDHCHLLPV